MNAPEPAATRPAATGGLPEAPYPGLRPFLAHEEILLFGRERQVREVLARLRESQFVAVIGGSGSGKSSLILAGVVPELRSFAIEGAGDFWVPLVSTPGTNATADDQAARLNTPITRLARKFAALLKSRGSPDADRQRLADIAECLRGQRGFAKLVRRYSSELAVDAGPDPEDARFLFVLDQFEELFHPTTRKSEDARHLIERVIDHFFSPNERCFVVLTMRSEHLNDCAGYLQLPDAINKASYLVRRLDTDELRAAITGPVQRLLRLHQRLDRDGARLPETIDFDTTVVKRLIDDTHALDANPDHLPLLQHVLARLWDAAVRRTSATLDLPDAITPGDLAMAVTAGTANAQANGVNALTASLENWAEAAYQGYPEADRARLDRLLRRLGVKDPNTGMYSQERIEVGEAAKLLGLPGAAELKALLEHGFLEATDYLYWDDADPARTTVKVSHESLIRGWPRLRAAIDAEAERYDAFVDLLRKAAGWQRHGRPDDDLLDAPDLRRVEATQLPALLADDAERARWLRRLEASHAHAALGAVGGDAAPFIAASQARQASRRAGEQRRKRNRALAIALALLAVPPLLYWTLVQGPVIKRTALMFQAGALANSTPLRKLQTSLGSEQWALADLMRAAVTLDRGLRGDTALAGINSVLLDRLSGLPFVSVQSRFVDQVLAGSEPVVNGSLRDQLQAWLWTGNPAETGEPVRRATVETADCTVRMDAGSSSIVFSRPGTLITARNPNAGAGAPASRSVFVQKIIGEDTDLEIRAATGDAANCTSRQLIMSIPLALNPVVAFDANLRNLFVVTDEAGESFVEAVEIDWEQDGSENAYTINKLPSVVLTGKREADLLRETVRKASKDPLGPAVLDTRRTDAGRAFMVGNEAWRVVDELAQRVPWDTGEQFKLTGRGDGSFPFVPLAAGSGACADLARVLEQQDRQSGVMFSARAFEDPANRRVCFIAKHGNPQRGPGPGAAPAAAGPTPLYHLVAAAYPRPTDAQLPAEGRAAAEPLPAPIARMPRFGRSIDGPRVQWWVGRPGTPYAGWLASLGPDRSGQWRFVAAPWSTCALWRLGKQIYEQQPVPQRLPAALGDADTCRDG